MKIVFTAKEIKEILIAAAVLSVAFSLAFSNGIIGGIQHLASLPMLIIFSFIAVGIGFLAHELIGHKIIAQRFGMYAEFRMWPLGLVIALVSSLAGFVFAAPGAVYVGSRMDLWGNVQPVSRKKMGLVSIAGPIINIALALAFLGLYAAYPSDLFVLAVFVNTWLALFNMLPIPPLDGSKVFAWDKKIWAAMFAVCVIMFVALSLF